MSRFLIDDTSTMATIYFLFISLSKSIPRYRPTIFSFTLLYFSPPHTNYDLLPPECRPSIFWVIARSFFYAVSISTALYVRSSDYCFVEQCVLPKTAALLLYVVWCLRSVDAQYQFFNSPLCCSEFIGTPASQGNRL